MIDRRFDGISKEAVEKYQKSTSADFSVGESSYELLKEELMEELFPEEGNTFTLISDRSKQIIKERGNVEALELLEVSKEFNVNIATDT